MQKRKYSVYKHTTPNQKVYIGITCQNPESRWGVNGRNYSGNQIFARAIAKYGWCNIQHEVLCSGLTVDEANAMEIALIAEYKSNSRQRGYNLTAGGGGMLGFKLSEETKKRLSDINKGKRHTEESRRKMSESRKGENAYWYGKKMSDEMRRKLSETKKGTNSGADSYWYGKKMPDEARRKMSENHYDTNGANNPRARKVEQCDKDGNVINVFFTITEAANHRGCCFSTMRRYLIGRYNDSSGFIWRYADEQERVST